MTPYRREDISPNFDKMYITLVPSPDKLKLKICFRLVNIHDERYDDKGNESFFNIRNTHSCLLQKGIANEFQNLVINAYFIKCKIKVVPKFTPHHVLEYLVT